MYSALALLSFVTLSFADFNILLLHTNDMHARFQQADRHLGMCENDTSTACYGGFARVKATVDDRRKAASAAGKPTIFLNAGDSFQGTPFYTFFKWPVVSKFISMLGIDVMSLGNHEFDDGVASLSEYIRNVTVPNVCSNLNLTLEPSLVEPNLTPSYILTVNNVRIGVIGYLTPDTTFLSNTGKVVILDEIPSIRKEAQRLLGLNITILIALGHSGYLKDQQIAKEVEEIDLVVGGHSHTFLYSGTPPDPVDIPRGPYPTVITQASGKQVPVVQAFYGTKYLGYLELDFDDKGNLKKWSGQPILLSGDLPQDQEVLAALQPYEKELEGKISRIVGYTGVLLDNEGFDCKLGECNMGNLITDAYVDYATRNYKPRQGWTVAAVAIQQSGGMRASINTQTNVNHNGSINLGDVITVLPWGGKIAVKDVNGSTLMELLEFSVSKYQDTLTGHVNVFLQVSGLKVEYDMKGDPGKRVVSVLVRCADCPSPSFAPLNLSASYGVAMPEYISTGGDGFSMLSGMPLLYTFDDIDYVVLSKYIELHTPINPTVEGRITIKNAKSSSPTTISMSMTFYIIILAMSLKCLLGEFC